MTIQETEQQIIDEFSNFDEWLDRYAYLIDLGRECPQIDEKDKTEQNLIKGSGSFTTGSENLGVKRASKGDGAGSDTLGSAALGSEGAELNENDPEGAEDG